MPNLTQEGIRIADSLTGYIAHIPGSYTCRHCELAQEIATALRTAQAQQREVDANIADSIRRSGFGGGAYNEGAIDVAAAIRRGEEGKE